VLPGANARGLKRAKLATGDGALVFWAALDEVFPSTTHERCRMHKTSNALNYLPKDKRARDDPHQIWMAEGREADEKAMALFEENYEDKRPRAVTCLTKDCEAVLALYDVPTSTGCTSAPPTPPSRRPPRCVIAPSASRTPFPRIPLWR